MLPCEWAFGKLPITKKTLMASSSIITLLFICFLYLRFFSTATNITSTKFLRDSETLVSNDSVFKIGFFSPVNSTNRYVGIWYNLGVFDVNNVVWIANRNNPINDSSGVLKISEDGNLQLSNRQNMTFWSSSVSHHANSTSIARLLDTGNLVLFSSASGNIIWQSFEHLTDSLLQQTNITIDPSLGRGMDGNPVLQSWKSASDPSNGPFSIYLIPQKNVEFFTLNGDNIHWRSGPWNGSHFLGVPYSSTGVFHIFYNDHVDTLNVLFSVADVSFLFYYKLNHDGNVIEKHWDDVTQKWESNWVSIMTECDLFGKCGPFGRCNPNDSPICNCLNGFKPKNTDEWSKGNWTSGCVRMTPLQCGITGGIEDGFSRLKHMKVPHNPSFELPQDKKKCRSKCLESCSCLAYAYEDGFGCMVWKYGNIVDVQVYSADGVDLYIRLASSELDPFNAPRKTQGDTSNIKKIIVITAVVGTTTFAVFGYCLWRLMHRRYGKKATNVETQIVDSEVDQAEFKDLSLFTFKDLEVATKCFSEINKLGQGGFGPVYKGKLENGQDIAVKRLSRASGQGLLEFMNEVLVISKLQHKNLVKLLGCCVEQEEKLLVYEYMPNNSLDALLFDTHHKIHLDWKKRFNIISGICRGLVYLHRDSRLKIIHRDLKASNILLDEDFNPKISDFGMARIFENKQDQANTLRVVGTYGYMSPEYAMEGRFSEKSDLFSLGVLLLEIVSGRKNSSFLNNESLSLLTYAWRLWTENDMLSLIDPTIFDPSFNGEILKCIQLGLLCVQEFPEDRPTISVLISMLDFYDIMDLPHPTQPGFIHRKVYSTDEILQSSQEQGSVNCLSLTAFSGR